MNLKNIQNSFIKYSFKENNNNNNNNNTLLYINKNNLN